MFSTHRSSPKRSMRREGQLRAGHTVVITTEDLDQILRWTEADTTLSSFCLGRILDCHTSSSVTRPRTRSGSRRWTSTRVSRTQSAGESPKGQMGWGRCSGAATGNECVGVHVSANLAKCTTEQLRLASADEEATADLISQDELHDLQGRMQRGSPMGPH